jgi:invasion protein IalB
MGLFAKRARGFRATGGAVLGLLMVSGAILVLLAFDNGALSQTLQQKQPDKATPTQPGPGQTAPSQPNWAVNCSNIPAGLDCRAIQSLFFKSSGQRLLSVVVHVPPDTKKPELLLQLPLGVYLPAGASLQIGKDAAKTVPYKSCDQYGCLAEYAITEAEIAAMSKGSDLTITMQNLNQQPVTVTLPALGFAAAYAKLK